LVFNPFGDLERCVLRPGNVHSADSWESVLKPVVARYRGKVCIYFRADVGFANSQVYELLETERIKYAIRLPANRICKRGSATGSSALSAARPTMSGNPTRASSIRLELDETPPGGRQGPMAS
jgi:hypothetical protein